MPRSFTRPIAIALCLATTTVVAHDGIKNPQVKARMDLMVEIREAMQVLGGMAQGKRSFDLSQADAARDQLIALARTTPAAFEARATDPKSEALPAIWENFDDFTARSAALVSAAQALGTGSLSELQAGIGAVGQTCGGCHRQYRLQN